MVIGFKSAPAFGTKGIIIIMVINSWLTFPLVDMKWLDSDCKLHIPNWVSTLETSPYL